MEIRNGLYVPELTGKDSAEWWLVKQKRYCSIASQADCQSIKCEECMYVPAHLDYFINDCKEKNCG